jgi:predicted esterase
LINLSPRDLQLESASVTATVPFTFRHRPAPNAKVVAIFLHGYADHGGSLLRRLFENSWPESFQNVAVLAPNGVFPVPVKTDAGWREAYAWYFYDEKEQRMFISPEASTRGCVSLLEKFGYQNLPKILIGFSQGGYLAPYLAPHLSNVKEIIGIGTGYRDDFYPSGETWKLTAVHGTRDEVFPIASARTTHTAILKKGFSGEFHEIPNLNHVASPEVGRIVEQRIKKWID